MIGVSLSAFAASFDTSNPPAYAGRSQVRLVEGDLPASIAPIADPVRNLRVVMGDRKVFKYTLPA